MHFLITAYDGKDKDAPARRQAARAAHLENAGRLYEARHLVTAAAVMDEAGGMIGSSLLVDFPDRAAVESAVRDDPYTKQGVWKDVRIEPVRLAFGAR